MNYQILSIIVLCLAATGGLYMITRVFKNERPPRPVAYIHGTIAAIGYGILLYYSFGDTKGVVNISTILLTIAFIGGLVLFSFDTVKKRVPKVFAVIHATAAISGIVSLILFAIGH